MGVPWQWRRVTFLAVFFASCLLAEPEHRGKSPHSVIISTGGSRVTPGATSMAAVPKHSAAEKEANVMGEAIIANSISKVEQGDKEQRFRILPAGLAQERKEEQMHRDVAHGRALAIEVAERERASVQNQLRRKRHQNLMKKERDEHAENMEEKKLGKERQEIREKLRVMRGEVNALKTAQEDLAETENRAHRALIVEQNENEKRVEEKNEKEVADIREAGLQTAVAEPKFRGVIPKRYYHSHTKEDRLV